MVLWRETILKILVCREAGFCFGVKRAIEQVEELSVKTKSLKTFGDLIHNNQVIQDLEQKGIKTIDESSGMADICKEDTVVIRTHGAEKEQVKALHASEAKILDATCPFVTKVHKLAQKFDKEGYSVVLFGEEKHPEVKGIVSYLNREYYVVENTSQAEKLPQAEAYALVSQTTKEIDEFNKIVDITAKKCKKFAYRNTICNTTSKRQHSALKIAEKSDYMIVIGGRHSANTIRLFEICKKICKDIVHIETVEELETKDLSNQKVVGVTAGASTPDYLINNVVKFLKGI